MCDPHLWENVPKVQVAPLKSLTNHHTCGRPQPRGRHADTQGTDAELNILTPYVKLNPGIAVGRAITLQLHTHENK